MVGESCVVCTRMVCWSRWLSTVRARTSWMRRPRGKSGSPRSARLVLRVSKKMSYSSRVIRVKRAPSSSAATDPWRP